MASAVLWEEKPREGGRRVLEYVSDRSLTDIPEDVGCPGCGARLMRQLVTRNSYGPTGGPIIRGLKTPGYWCPSCEVDWYEPSSMLLMCRVATVILAEAGETASARCFEEEVARQEGKLSKHPAMV